MAKTSEAQLKAIAKYDKENTKMYAFKFSLKYDSDIIEKLSSVPNRQDYIKRIIRKDIESEETTMIIRTYGSEKTNLVLSGKALEFYNMTDPIRIEETEGNGHFLYQVYSGSEPMHDGMMTKEKLVKWLEDGYDELQEV